jgi:hypothetical protein
VTEGELLDEIVRLSAARSIIALHIPDRLARKMGPEWTGFPDLCLIGDNGLAFAELKADGRRGLLSPDQRQFARRLVMAGQVTYSWSPADLRSGWIGQVLDALGHDAAR